MTKLLKLEQAVVKINEAPKIDVAIFLLQFCLPMGETYDIYTDVKLTLILALM